MGSINNKPLDNAFCHPIINQSIMHLGHSIINHWIMHGAIINKPLDHTWGNLIINHWIMHGVIQSEAIGLISMHVVIQ